MRLLRFVFKLSLVAIALWALTAYALPNLLGGKLASYIQKATLAREVGAKISVSPPYKMFLGKIDQVKIHIKDMKFKALNVQDIKAKADSVKFNLKEFLKGNKVKIEKLSASDVEIKINEKDLTKYFQEQGMPDMVVQLRPSGAVISDKLEVLGRQMPVSISGNFVLSDSSRLKFQGNKISLGSRSLPSSISRRLLRELTPEVSVDSLGAPVRLKNLTMGDGSLTISGEIVLEKD